jgi:hypothetical protein
MDNVLGVEPGTRVSYGTFGADQELEDAIKASAKINQQRVNQYYQKQRDKIKALCADYKINGGNGVDLTCMIENPFGVVPADLRRWAIAYLTKASVPLAKDCKGVHWYDIEHATQ